MKNWLAKRYGVPVENINPPLASLPPAVREIVGRKCASCGTPIVVIELRDGWTFTYPCPCAEGPTDHPLRRVVLEAVLPDDD